MKKIKILLIIILGIILGILIINIIMWTMISKKEKKIRERTTPPHDINETLPDGVMEAAAVAGFKLIENTVIVHTNERIVP